jgi:hypothetical protein
VAVLTGGGPHDGRWELPGGWHFPHHQDDTGGTYLLTRRFGEQYKGRPPQAGKDGGLYEWRPANG